MAAASPHAPVSPRIAPDLHESARALLEPQTRELDRDPGNARADHLAQRYSEWLRARHAAYLHDGCAPQARRVLARLIAHERARKGAAVRHAPVPSLLEQVCDAVQSSRGNGHRTSAGVHRAAIGLSAAELLGSIERAVGRGPRGELTRRVWAWVRVHAADTAAAHTMAEWVDRARDVVSPPRPVGLVAACPECGRRVVYVEDAGERVRRPALQVDRATGQARCTAPGCRAKWGPEHLPLLARVLEQQAGERVHDPGATTVRAERVLYVQDAAT